MSLPSLTGPGVRYDPDVPQRRVDARWVGTGSAGDADAETAGRSAAGAAVTGADTKLLVVFAAERYDLDRLLTGVRSAAPGAAVAGCTTAGELATTTGGDVGVVVLALGGSGFDVSTAVARSASRNLRTAGAEAASCLDRVDPGGSRVLMLLTDGLAGDQQEIVRGAYSAVGAGVPLVGGCAGDDLRMRRTQQICGDEVLTDAVVAVAIRSTGPIGIGVQHGWRRVGEPMLVTGSSGTQVHTIDDEPALDVYLRRLEAPVQAWTDPETFTRFASTHPLGLARRRSEVVRFVAGADFATRSLICIAEVPQGGLAWFMEGDVESVLTATDDACREALAGLGGAAPRGLLAFDCVARRGVLGDAGVRREVDRIADTVGGAPVAGFFTYGEIARTRGVSGFHNQTLVVLALG